jgi:hypothetical protein
LEISNQGNLGKRKRETSIEVGEGSRKQKPEKTRGNTPTVGQPYHCHKNDRNTIFCLPESD